MTKNIHIVCFSALRRLFAVFALALMLCACDWDNNFFYQPVDFRGEAEEPQLVVNAILEADSTPVIYLNRSVFFLDKHATDSTIYTEAYSNGQLNTDYSYTSLGLQRGYITDASVEMCINGDEWLPLVCKEVTITRTNRYSTIEYRTPGWAYVSDVKLRAGDRVEVRIAHKDYPKGASIVTVIPVRAGATVSKPDFDTKRKPYLTPVVVTLPPYKGDPTDVLCFRAVAYAYAHRCFYNFSGIDPQTGDSLWIYDEHNSSHERIAVIYHEAVYSKDIAFARFDNINQKLSQNGFGSLLSVGLFCDVNRTDENRSIELEVPYEPYGGYYYSSKHSIDDTLRYVTSFLQTDSIVIEVRSVNRDAYLYLSSMMQAGYISNEVYDPWLNNSGNPDFDLGEILDNIQDAFSEMGSMEGIQIYGNAKGAFGQVGAVTTERIVVRRE